MKTDYRDLYWRIGRSLGRTVYAQAEAVPGPLDELIGLMDTIELAEEVVRNHNAILQAYGDTDVA